MPLAKCYGPWSRLQLDMPFKCHVDTAKMTNFTRQPNTKYVFIDSEPPWACTPLSEMIQNAPRYDAIMTTYNEDIIDKIPNAFLHRYKADPYIDPLFKPEFEEKKFYVSYLVSNWRETKGEFWIRKPAAELLMNHSVPHKVWSGHRTPFPGLDKIPRTYPPDVLDDYNKSILFDAMFSIATENHIQRNHWQEKLLGCFWTRTVPIYFGCPNVDEFGFREDGILRFNTVDELKSILDKLTPELYEEMKEAIEHNFQLATTEYDISQHVDLANAITRHFLGNVPESNRYISIAEFNKSWPWNNS